jgi:rhodanese-related sulfurtransferase
MASLLSPREADALVKRGDAVLVDIREPDEFGQTRIPGAFLQPLSVLDILPPDPAENKTAISFCRSSARATEAAALLDKRQVGTALIMEGGLNAWAEHLPVEKSARPLPLMRQTQIAAGLLILLFLGLGQLAPLFRLLAAGVGAGLVFAGLSGTCGLALLLKRLPWNAPRNP